MSLSRTGARDKLKPVSAGGPVRVNWRRVPGKAGAVAISKAGTVYHTDVSIGDQSSYVPCDILMWDGGGWVKTGVRTTNRTVLAGGHSNSVLFVGEQGGIFFWSPDKGRRDQGMWIEREEVVDLSCGGIIGIWLVVGQEPIPTGWPPRSIRVYGVMNGPKWHPTINGGARVAAGDGRPWVVDTDHSIIRFTNKGWKRRPGAARDIGVSMSGDDVWCIGADGKFYRLNRGRWGEVTGPKNASALEVGPNGVVWCIDSEGRMYRKAGERPAPAASEEPQAIKIKKLFGMMNLLSTRELIHRPPQE